VIVEWLMSMSVSVATWVLSWFDGEGVPEFFDTFADIIAQVVAGSVGLGAWIPWAFLFSTITAVVSVWLIGFLIKGARWLVGWVPTMGGS